ncbi:polysaccharide biosynthesis tyrosine autokinase [Methylotenera sp.]|uniref:polysaccharide biosynthesis tyrosine autokinase n=1 Tax=Methylotenera sp. TaxID=2051956 RepID=UPI0027308AAA|nr:polysaccharide biosynthesis tyrosine autokinase [Methylotenera sp.]MDP2229632.1 polysaccharide biosynthesis tyrosine autokinase [Methylotenera sp.]
MDYSNNTYQLNNDHQENVHLENDHLENDHVMIGDALIAHAKLTQQDKERILALQKEKNILFGDAAKQLGLISDADLKKALSQQFNYAYVHEDSRQLNQILIAAHAPFSEEAENLRSLRGQLLTRWFDLGNKSLAVTSANVEDGANQLAANLAIVFSQLNKKTLLIDANLRQATQHKLFDVDTKLGLANILANKQGSYQLTRQQSLPNLYILTAGTEVPNPQELLSKEEFAELLLDLEKIYDIILIDTSPLSLGSDVFTVAAKAKAAIIVARKDYTLAAKIQKLNLQLGQAGAKVIGSILQEF